MDARKRCRGDGLVKAGDLLAGLVPVPELCFDEVIRSEDIGYTHPVFMQCFMPMRHTPKNKQRWQVNCGRASLVIRAGELIKPGEPNTFQPREVPAGPKARILNAYTNDYILRHRTQTIDLADSLRKAMERMNISISGKSGRLLKRELENYAAAEIILGVWTADHPIQEQAKVAKRLSFWLERDERQMTIWNREMTVSDEYYHTLINQNRMAPFYWPALLNLQNDTRAMDIHCYLIYRLRNGLQHPVVLHKKVLHAMFGHDTKELFHFWPRFQESLLAAHKWYPKARIEVKNDCIILKNSPPLIPHRV